MKIEKFINNNELATILKGFDYKVNANNLLNHLSFDQFYKQKFIPINYMNALIPKVKLFIKEKNKLKEFVLFRTNDELNNHNVRDLFTKPPFTLSSDLNSTQYERYPTVLKSLKLKEVESTNFLIDQDLTMEFSIKNPKVLYHSEKISKIENDKYVYDISKLFQIQSQNRELILELGWNKTNINQDIFTNSPNNYNEIKSSSFFNDQIGTKLDDLVEECMGSPIKFSLSIYNVDISLKEDFSIDVTLSAKALWKQNVLRKVTIVKPDLLRDKSKYYNEKDSEFKKNSVSDNEVYSTNVSNSTLIRELSRKRAILYRASKPIKSLLTENPNNEILEKILNSKYYTDQDRYIKFDEVLRILFYIKELDQSDSERKYKFDGLFFGNINEDFFVTNNKINKPFENIADVPILFQDLDKKLLIPSQNNNINFSFLYAMKKLISIGLDFLRRYKQISVDSLSEDLKKEQLIIDPKILIKVFENVTDINKRFCVVVYDAMNANKIVKIIKNYQKNKLTQKELLDKLVSKTEANIPIIRLQTDDNIVFNFNIKSLTNDNLQQVLLLSQFKKSADYKKTLQVDENIYNHGTSKNENSLSDKKGARLSPLALFALPKQTSFSVFGNLNIHVGAFFYVLESIENKSILENLIIINEVEQEIIGNKWVSNISGYTTLLTNFNVFQNI